MSIQSIDGQSESTIELFSPLLMLVALLVRKFFNSNEWAEVKEFLSAAPCAFQGECARMRKAKRISEHLESLEREQMDKLQAPD